MASFNPVTPGDFFDQYKKYNFKNPSNPLNWATWTVSSTIGVLSGDKLGFASDLATQLALHRPLSSIESDLSSAKKKISDKTAEVTKYKNKIENLKKKYPGQWDNPADPLFVTLQAQILDWQNKLNAAKEYRDNALKPWRDFLKQELDASIAYGKKKKTYKSGKSTGGATSGVKVKDLPLNYNVGSVKEAYFSSQSSFNDFSVTTYANSPKAISNASELWTTAGGHKGMIQTWGEITTNQQFKDAQNKTSDISIKNYGFQFLYNPTSVIMSYSGIPDVDITMYTSGKAGTNLWSPNSFQSTITFDVLLNRMFDLKYYDKNRKKIRSEVKPEDIYPGRIPGADDQELISEKGTMYDVEYLLSTTLGFKQRTNFRGTTADVGWVSAMPVELHLGNKLRYLVVVSGINITHVIFDERMVPVFSVMKVSCQRIPDYPTTTDTSGGTGFGGGSSAGGTSAYDPRGYKGPWGQSSVMPFTNDAGNPTFVG